MQTRPEAFETSSKGHHTNILLPPNWPLSHARSPHARPLICPTPKFVSGQRLPPSWQCVSSVIHLQHSPATPSPENPNLSLPFSSHRFPFLSFPFPFLSFFPSCSCSNGGRSCSYLLLRGARIDLRRRWLREEQLLLHQGGVQNRPRQERCEAVNQS